MNRSLFVQDWLAIADGKTTMPPAFQRFIAAWELIVAWHRTQYPENTRDESLIPHLKAEMNGQQLGSDPKWKALVADTLPWQVTEMMGSNPTGRIRRFEHVEDVGNAIDAIYTIRCNLLKAGKNPEDSSDQRITGIAAIACTYIARRLHGLW